MSAPLSPFVKTGNLIFVSGQVGLDPASSTIPADFASQAKNVFLNLVSVLASADVALDNVIKVNVYMTDLSLFEEMNRLYVEFFGEHRPARTTIGVAALPEFPGDPRVLIEIEAVAECSLPV